MLPGFAVATSFFPDFFSSCDQGQEIKLLDLIQAQRKSLSSIFYLTSELSSSSSGDFNSSESAAIPLGSNAIFFALVTWPY